MNKDLFFLGKPAPFQNGVLVYPPLVSDIVSNSNYNLFTKMLTYSQEEIEDLFTEAGERMDSFPTPLEFLLANCYNNKDYERLCKEAFLFFTHQEANFLYEEKKVIFGDLNKILAELSDVEDLSKLAILDEDNFLDFQNLVREANCLKMAEAPDPTEHPRLKAMKAKQRLRDRVKAKQGKGISFFNSLVAICCMGIGITPLTIGEMSYVAIQEIIGMYQQRERYQIDIDTLLAGGDSKKIKPKYWMENLEN